MSCWLVDVRARLQDFELEVALEGHPEPLAIVGPNGAGKSTLLKVVAGLIETTEGRVTLQEQSWLDEGTQVAPEHRQVGWLPQGAPMFAHLRVSEALRFGRKASDESASLWRDRLDLQALCDRFTDSLSGGQKQQVALAQILANEPKWILLDEPFRGLDAPARMRTLEILRHIEVPLWFTSHDLREAAALGARVAVLDQGRLIAHQSVAHLVADPPNALMAAMAKEVQVYTQVEGEKSPLFDRS